ncbi:FHA domain-containing protein [Nocardia huaxiensis]|uniref:FHA domain-containing protein n=1 Tax=Nocardia huaxiensis TaxID=2755382 RepID=UPI001E40BD6B|nr:FHA domain-containing protein [Nocardia huaxiensis]UFS98134.1 FHA domain-containing protein [Nocardia huaxiensis]
MRGRVEVVPGEHPVACVDGVVVVVAHREAGPVTAASRAVSVLDTLEELVRESSSRETRRTGRTFARLATTWLMGREDEESVEFGVLTPGTRAMAIFLHGGITAVLDGTDHREILHGRNAGFSIDRVVFPAPDRAAALFIDDTTPRTTLPEPGVWSLHSGRMPGSGAVLWLPGKIEFPSSPHQSSTTRTPAVTAIPAARSAPETPHSTAPSASAPPNTPAPDAQSAPGSPNRPNRGAPAAERTGASTPAQFVPQQRGGDPMPRPPTATPETAARPAVTVRGFLCARGHLNDPRVHTCTGCGIPVDHSNTAARSGIRPPLGRLLLDDGTAYPLDADLVIGREPHRSEQVRRGATAVRIDDASTGMSRVHTEIRLVDWDVTVLDRGSANGTHLRPPGHADWTRAVPGHPATLAPGTQILVGGRIFTFEAPHPRG